MIMVGDSFYYNTAIVEQNDDFVSLINSSFRTGPIIVQTGYYIIMFWTKYKYTKWGIN